MRRFAIYWASATTSYLGDGVRFVALPLLAVSLSSSPIEVAAIAAAAGLPWLVFGLVAGVVVDRVDRIRLMTITQSARAAVGAALVVGVASGRLTIVGLAALVFVLYTCEVFYDIAFNSALPAIVDRSQLQWANGRLITAEVVTFEFVGPALGGVLFAVSPVLPFAVDGATFVVSAALLLLVSRGTTRIARPPDPAASVRRELADGMRWFWRQGVVRSLTLIAVAVNLAAGGFYAVLVLLVRDELAVGPAGYGFLIAVGAVGAVIGGPVAGRLTSGARRRAVVLMAVPVTATCFAVVAVSDSVVPLAAAMIVFGFTVTLANVVMVSLRQLLTPDEVLGRVMGVHRVLCWGALPVGAVLAGTVGEAWGIRVAIGSCAVAAVLVAVPVARPLLRVPEFDPRPGNVAPAPPAA